ncbi:MAG: DNA primase, partial [Verrucomicrobiales bacterium]|nr:DNA primase [Verrucomicrobiales bacterium]
MGLIPEETKLEVLAATDIVDLVSSYQIQLKRAGGNFKGLCPFHDEKTPSFNVTPSRGIYYCFGCGAGGDAIRFVMQYESLPYPEALKKLAARAGINIAEDVYDPDEEKRSKLRRRITLLHKDITTWFTDLLLKNPIAGGARDYLKSRGVTSDVARRWNLGYAPNDVALFANWARTAGYSAREMVAAGILSLKDDDTPSRGTYARFRDRLMFPVANHYGDVIAFSGRLLDPEAKSAKYLNSPETIIFNTSKVFYGLDRAARPITKSRSTIICEGQLDLITCAEAGIENVVAALGTAFTEHHARTLARYAPEVVLCYDADNAGFKAAERAFAELAKSNLDVRVAVMPDGQDPDSLIRSEGADAFRAILENARPFFDYQVDRGLGSLDLSSIKDRVAFAHNVAANIARLTDNIAVDTAILNVATRLRLPPDELRDIVTRKRRDDRGKKSTNNPTSDGGTTPPSPPIINDRTVASICRLACTDPTAHNWIRGSGYIKLLAEIPETDLALKILKIQIDPSDPGASAKLLSSLSDPEQTYIASLIASPSPYAGIESAKILLLELEKSQLQRRLGALQGNYTDPSTDLMQEIIH